MSWERSRRAKKPILPVVQRRPRHTYFFSDRLSTGSPHTFGNALGNSIVGAIQLQGERNKLGAAGKDQYDYAIGQGKTPQQALEVARFADEQDMQRFFADGARASTSGGVEPSIRTAALGEPVALGAPTPIAPEPLTAAQREQLGVSTDVAELNALQADTGKQPSLYAYGNGYAYPANPNLVTSIPAVPGTIPLLSATASTPGADVLQATFGASLEAAARYGALNRVTTTTSELQYVLRANAESTSVFAVNGAGDAMLANRVAVESSSAISLASSSESALSLSREVVPSSSSTLVESATGLRMNVGATNATLEASGILRATQVTAGSISPAFAQTFKILGSPYLGGTLDVGLNYLGGNYDLYKPTSREIFGNSFGAGYDFVSGTLKGIGSGAAGVFTGTLTAGFSAPFIGPAAPYAGIAVGGGVTVGTDLALKNYVFDPLRPLAVNAALHTYDFYNQSIEPLVNRIEK